MTVDETDDNSVHTQHNLQQAPKQRTSLTIFQSRPTTTQNVILG